MSKKKLFDEDAAIKFSEKLAARTTDKDVEKIEKGLGFMNRGPVAKIWDKVQELWAAFKDPSTPWYKKTMIIGGLAYLVLPIDLISDVIPAIGLIDDVFVILYVAKQVLELTASKIIEVIREPIDAKIKEKINEILNKAMKNALLKTLITLLITAIGLMFVILKPFSETIAFTTASVIFIGLLAYSVYNTVSWIIEVWPWLKSVWRERSIKKGIIAEVKTQYHALEVYENILAKGAVFIHALDEIPDLEQIFDHYVDYFKKKVLIFGIAIAVYCLIVYWILKPFLINQFGGLKTWQLYLYPAVHIFKFFTGK